jgi:hypothetical protein
MFYNWAKDFEVRMPLTNHVKNAKAKPLIAAGMMVCASVLVAPAARADDSLWSKAIGSIGLGGAASSAKDSAPAAPTAPAPQQNVQAPQPKQDVTSSNPVRSAPQESVSQAAPGQGPNLLTNWFGWGRGGETSAQGVSTQQASAAAPTQKAISPIQTVAPPPPPPPARAAEPSMWDKMLGSVGVAGGGSPDTINYNERPKLAVPKDRALPPAPQVAGEPPPTRAANGDYLVKPPESYLEKVRGPDGVVSGLRDSDMPKDKKFFGLF